MGEIKRRKKKHLLMFDQRKKLRRVHGIGCLIFHVLAKESQQNRSEKKTHKENAEYKKNRTPFA